MFLSYMMLENIGKSDHENKCLSVIYIFVCANMVKIQNFLENKKEKDEVKAIFQTPP